MIQTIFRYLLAIGVCVVLTRAGLAGELRKWTDASGRFSINAELLEIHKDNVVLKKEDRTETRISRIKLSARDRAYVRTEEKKESAKKAASPMKSPAAPAPEPMASVFSNSWAYPLYLAPYWSGCSGYGHYHHASTLEEGWYNGIANFMHAAGTANLLNSMAARHIQAAISHRLFNRVKAMHTYFEMRRINRESVRSERGPRVSSEAMHRIAEARAPERLSSRDFDMLTGRIYWPAALEDDAFQGHRAKLDELTLKWAPYKRLEGAERLALVQSVKAMQAELKVRITHYPPAEYVKARKLLESLAYEVAVRDANVAKAEGVAFIAR